MTSLRSTLEQIQAILIADPTENGITLALKLADEVLNPQPAFDKGPVKEVLQTIPCYKHQDGCPS